MPQIADVEEMGRCSPRLAAAGVKTTDALLGGGKVKRWVSWRRPRGFRSDSCSNGSTRVDLARINGISEYVDLLEAAGVDYPPGWRISDCQSAGRAPVHQRRQAPGATRTYPGGGPNAG